MQHTQAHRYTLRHDTCTHASTVDSQMNAHTCAHLFTNLHTRTKSHERSETQNQSTDLAVWSRARTCLGPQEHQLPSTSLSSFPQMFAVAPTRCARCLRMSQRPRGWGVARLPPDVSMTRQHQAERSQTLKRDPLPYEVTGRSACRASGQAG